MKILVTGGAGFIGSHLAEKLLNEGNTVYVIDNLSTGNLKNIEHLTSNKEFHYTIDTILDEKVMDGLISKCDQIYHMAAAVGVKLIMDKPLESIETNVKGTEILLKLANKYKKKVLIASTSEIYGGHKDGKLHEDHDRLLGSVKKWRWAYACSKTLDEFLALAYHLEKKLPVVCVRLFNTVGPRQTGQYGMVLPNFVQSALLNKPIHVYGTGEQLRSFTYVDDVVGAMTKLMAAPEAEGDVFNIGSEEEISMKGLAEKIKAVTKSTSPIKFVPYEQVYGEGFEDMMRRMPDISKISRVIGYKPRYKLDDIINNVIEYFKK